MDPLTQTLSPLHHIAKTPTGDLHYWEYNPDKTPTIVVIHGYRGTHHGLERIIAHLPEVRFIVPDLPGFGLSAPLTGTEHTIANYAIALADFIAANHMEGSILLGHSMGSIVAAELIAHHPELMRSLILINPIAAHPLKGMSSIIVRPSIVYHWLGGKVLPRRIGRKLLDSKAFLLFGSIVMAKTTDAELRQLIHATHLKHMVEYHSPSSLYDAYKASLSGTVRDRAAHIRIPTLLIAGGSDELSPPTSQQHLAAELSDAELIILDKVGHLIHYEKPREAAAEIAKFLTRQAARKSQ